MVKPLGQDSLDMNGGFIDVVRIANRSWEWSVPGFWSRTFLNMGISWLVAGCSGSG
jgi:hypothetical protein